jgi:hypothetical protein
MNRRTLLFCLAAALFSGACSLATPTRLASNDDDEFGIGGTGIVADSALGIIGQVTGYGSIFVNGIEIETTADSDLRIDGQAHAMTGFHLGDVVEVLTQDNRPYTRAARLNLRHELIGPIALIDNDTQQLSILGQRVRLNTAVTPPIHLAAGDWVAVAGFRDAEGIIHASRISPAPGREVLLRGVLQQGKGGLMLGDQRLQLLTPTQIPEQAVLIRGHLIGSEVQVTTLETDPIFPYPGVSNWRIEGFSRRYSGMPDPQMQTIRHTPGMPEIFELERLPQGAVSITPVARKALPRGARFPHELQDARQMRQRPTPGGQPGGNHRGRR